MSETEVGYLKDILSELGYNSDQISVYIVCLTLGTKPISTIAKKTGFSRSKTYDITKVLIEQGLLQEYARNNVLHFTAAKPSKVLSLIKNRRDSYDQLSSRLTKILPIIEEFGLKNINKTKIELWRGDDAVCSLWEETLDHPNTTVYGLLDYATSWPNGRDAKFVAWDKRYSELRTERNISMYSVCNRSLKSDDAFRGAIKYKRYMKMIEQFNFGFEFAIHIDSIKVICNDDEVSGIVIRDQVLAETFQTLFLAIWNRLPEYHLP